MSDTKIRLRLAEIVARQTTSAAEASAMLDALYRFMKRAKD
jgi:hypothetical protein